MIQTKKAAARERIRRRLAVVNLLIHFLVSSSASVNENQTC